MNAVLKTISFVHISRKVLWIPTIKHYSENLHSNYTKKEITYLSVTSNNEAILEMHFKEMDNVVICDRSIPLLKVELDLHSSHG